MIFLGGGRVGGIRSSGQGCLYRFILLKILTALTHLNLSSTTISNCHFQQIIQITNNLDILDIFNCPGLDLSCIF